MARYVLIESRDPFGSTDPPWLYDLAADLTARGEEVTLFLVQNGVLAARKNVASSPLRGIRERNVAVMADSFSLRERGIREEDRTPQVDAAGIDDLVDLILAHPGTRVLWH